MIQWLKEFFTDKTAFVGYMRALLLGAGAAQASGLLDMPEIPKWVGVACMALGGFLRAGEPNAPNVQSDITSTGMGKS